jgi:hypothetical protein
MNKQDRQGSRTISDLERKYNFGRTFAEAIGIAEDAQKIANEANKAVSDLDAQLDPDEIFNRLTNYGTAQGIYRENGDIYVNATYIKSGKLAAEFIDAENLTVYAANIEGTLTAEQIDVTTLTVDAANVTGSMTADRIKLGGNMTMYQSVDSDVSAGTIGYTTVNASGNLSFKGTALGIVSEDHATLMAPNGNLIAVSYADVILGSSAGQVRMSGTELKFNGKAIMDRLNCFEQAFNALNVRFEWYYDD